MKTILHIAIPLFAICSPFSVSAQISNPGFESATVGSSGTQPDQWTVQSFGNNLSTDAHTGTYAMSVWNWYYYAKGFVSNGSKTASLQPIPGEPYLYNGEPIGFKPISLQGFYTYDTAANGGHIDSAVVQVTLSRYNTSSGSREVIGFGEIMLPVAQNYTAFEVPVNYTSALDPDTVVVSLISSVNGFCDNTSDGNCLYFNVDDLYLSSPAGLSAYNNNKTLVQHWPNPASNVLYLSIAGSETRDLHCEITDLSGQIVLSQNMYTANPSINISALNQGVYLYTIRNNKGRSLYTGKVFVTR